MASMKIWRGAGSVAWPAYRRVLIQPRILAKEKQTINNGLGERKRYRRKWRKRNVVANSEGKAASLEMAAYPAGVKLWRNGVA